VGKRVLGVGVMKGEELNLPWMADDLGREFIIRGKSES